MEPTFAEQYVFQGFSLGSFAIKSKEINLAKLQKPLLKLYCKKLKGVSKTPLVRGQIIVRAEGLFVRKEDGGENHHTFYENSSLHYCEAVEFVLQQEGGKEKPRGAFQALVDVMKGRHSTSAFALKKKTVNVLNSRQSAGQHSLFICCVNRPHKDKFCDSLVWTSDATNVYALVHLESLINNKIKTSKFVREQPLGGLESQDGANEVFQFFTEQTIPCEKSSNASFRRNPNESLAQEAGTPWRYELRDDFFRAASASGERYIDNRSQTRRSNVDKEYEFNKGMGEQNGGRVAYPQNKTYSDAMFKENSDVGKPFFADTRTNDHSVGAIRNNVNRSTSLNATDSRKTAFASHRDMSVSGARDMQMRNSSIGVPSRSLSIPSSPISITSPFCESANLTENVISLPRPTAILSAHGPQNELSNISRDSSRDPEDSVCSLSNLESRQELEVQQRSSATLHHDDPRSSRPVAKVPPHLIAGVKVLPTGFAATPRKSVIECGSPEAYRSRKAYDFNPYANV